MTRRRIYSILAFVTGTLLLPVLASGQACDAPVAIQVTTTGSYTNQCIQDPLTSRWNVTITLTGVVSSNPVVSIRGANTVQLGRVTIQNNTAIDCRVNILGSGVDQRIGGVGYVGRGTSGANRVLLLQLWTAGDVGYDKPAAAAIDVDMISNMSVGGNVLGDLISRGPSRAFGNNVIAGDLRGGLSLGATSSIDYLAVGGSIGSPDSLATFTIPGNIQYLSAGAIYADIDARAGGAAGTVHMLETISGPFKGSLAAHRLNRLATGPGNWYFHIAGDLDASITLTRDVRVPFTVDGAFRAQRLVNGTPVDNVLDFSAGTYDGNTEPVSTSMTFAGDCSGRMVLGQALAVGLGSINRDINVGGAFTGSISTAGDLAASLNVTGGGTGSVVLGGSARAGTMMHFGGPLASTGLISIAGSLNGGIAVPALGFQGQVIINAGGAGGAWNGSIVVGGISPFTPVPHYVNKSDPIGGGAVGLAPFVLHTQDCRPDPTVEGVTPAVSAAAFVPADPPPVVVSLYGPVEPNGVTISQAVVVEQDQNATWIDRSSNFSIGFLPPGAASGRQIGVNGTGAQITPGRYRVRPVPGALRSALVAGGPLAVWSDPFVFEITPGQAPVCPCDINHNGTLSVQDLFDFLNLYFAADMQADFNNSGTLSIQDLFDFIGCFFAPPSGC